MTEATQHAFGIFFLRLPPPLSLSLPLSDPISLSMPMSLSLSLSLLPLPTSPDPRLCSPPQVPSVSDWQPPTPVPWRAWGSQPDCCLLNKEGVPLGAWELSPLPSLSLHTLRGVSESIITLSNCPAWSGFAGPLWLGEVRAQRPGGEEPPPCPSPGRSCLLMSCSRE